MRLNAIEYRLMNNAVRSALQRHVEAPRLRRLSPPRDIRRALEVGCGRGIGLGIIADQFGALSIDGFDLDPRMVRAAATRAGRVGRPVHLWVGDVLAIPTADATYDAVFDFGIIHHVPDWRAAVREIARVLAPGGTFYGEEVLRPLIRATRGVLRHPQTDRFDACEFLAMLSDAGFTVVTKRSIGRLFVLFAARRRAA